MVLIVVLTCCFTAVQAAEAPPFQKAPFVFQTDKILPADLLSAANYRVSNRVLNDGFINTYTLSTPPWGHDHRKYGHVENTPE